MRIEQKLLKERKPIGGKRGMGRRKLADPTENEYQRYWSILGGDVEQKDTERTTESTCAPYLKERPLK